MKSKYSNQMQNFLVRIPKKALNLRIALLFCFRENILGVKALLFLNCNYFFTIGNSIILCYDLGIIDRKYIVQKRKNKANKQEKVLFIFGKLEANILLDLL